MKAPQSIDIDDYRRKVENLKELYEDADRRWKQYGDNPRTSRFLLIARDYALLAYTESEEELKEFEAQHDKIR